MTSEFEPRAGLITTHLPIRTLVFPHRRTIPLTYSHEALHLVLSYVTMRAATGNHDASLGGWSVP